MNNLKQRRTIRKYSSEDISETFLTQLLTEAERTPTMGNLQLYSVVISRNSEMKRRLAPAHFNQPIVESAPVVLTFCADSRRTTLWARQRKGNPGYNNFLSFVNAAADALLYCQTFCNLAEEKGLGTCFLGTTFYNPLSIVETLALPRLVMPVGTITLGWPAESPDQSERLPIESIIHSETYCDYTPELIDRFYAEKESLPANRQFVEINNKETLAQVFTDIRYTRADNEHISATLISALKHQGFLD